MTERTSAIEIERVAIRLSTGKPVLLKQVSVGANTPAVRPEGMHAFVVLGLRGEPLAYAHDAWEAAKLALELDGDDEATARAAARPTRWPTDAWLAAEVRLDRALDGAFERADWWLYMRRGGKGDMERTAAVARTLTVEDLIR